MFTLLIRPQNQQNNIGIKVNVCVCVCVCTNHTTSINFVFIYLLGMYVQYIVVHKRQMHSDCLEMELPVFLFFLVENNFWEFFPMIVITNSFFDFRYMTLATCNIIMHHLCANDFEIYFTIFGKRLLLIKSQETLSAKCISFGFLSHIHGVWADKHFVKFIIHVDQHRILKVTCEAYIHCVCLCLCHAMSGHAMLSNHHSNGWLYDVYNYRPLMDWPEYN